MLFSKTFAQIPTSKTIMTETFSKPVPQNCIKIKWNNNSSRSRLESNKSEAHVTSGKKDCLKFACVNARFLRNKVADVADHVVNLN